MKQLFITISLLIMMTMPTNAETAVFGGGCFWCTEAVFLKLKGVKKVESGYAGGQLPNPTYRDVCTGETGHAEVIRIEFNPGEISFGQLLEVFFLTHDPTTLNRQGADVGTQYRSVVFYTNPMQEKLTREIIQKLNQEKVYDQAIVTEVSPLKDFYLAEKEHQNYYARNNNQAYCRIVIQPKMEKFKKTFGNLIQ
ncbi:MAG: peptide-methionine (S)-S-oxide reductase MsrA [Prolixibacteraceae bacterium]|nr:peptide-methionine (S)-S-oxide reductase MsrA [Prolixibacteraceae bacterium]